jgi:predicted Zn finger-like uncharacterized protein
MLMICPNCQAGYQVPDHLLAGNGRRLRCARCAHEWQGRLPDDVAPEPEPTPDPPPAPVTAAIPVVSAPIASRNLPVGGLVAWAASLLLVGSLGWGAMHWRDNVMAKWPPSTRAYQAIGLD